MNTVLECILATGKVVDVVDEKRPYRRRIRATFKNDEWVSVVRPDPDFYSHEDFYDVSTSDDELFGWECGMGNAILSQEDVLRVIKTLANKAEGE